MTNTQKPVLLVVSFGTSHVENCELTIGAIENAIAAANPEYEVRRAFTSRMILKALESRYGLHVDSVKQAMERLMADGVSEVIVQPTQVMPGIEYDEMCKTLESYRDRFRKLVVGQPLLVHDRDYDALIHVLVQELVAVDTPDTAIVFMGHGSPHRANVIYTQLQERMHAAGHDNYFVGTVEARPDVEDVLEMVKAGELRSVVMLPLMIVAGDHANNDMAGDEEDSWKSVFERAGFRVRCILKGMGQYPGVQQIFVKLAAGLTDESI